MLCSVTRLSEVLQDAKGERSIDAIADQARAKGHPIDRATVARALQGRHAKHPPEVTLQGLAAGFGLDVRKLRGLIGAPSGELGPYVPAHESARLNRAQREALNSLIKAIVTDQEVRDAGQAEAQKTTTLEGDLGEDFPVSKKSVSPTD